MRRAPETLFARILLMAVVTAAALAACTDNDTAIFYYVENEQPVVDYSLDNDSTILGMGSAGGFYFVSLGGSLWERPTTGTTWVKVPLPAGTDFCTALVVYAGNVYAATIAGSSGALWAAAPAAQPVWAAVSDPDINGKQITALFVAGPGGSERLFAASMESETSYSLYSSPDGAAGTFTSTGITGKTKPVNQVTWDGTEYYAAVGTQIIRGDAGTSSMITDATPAAAGGAIIGGVYYSAGWARYYASTEEGELLQTADGTNPASWASTGEIDVSGTTVRFTRISEVGVSPGNIVIGSMEHGVYQLFQTGNVGSNDRLVDTTDSELYNGDVRDFFVDPADSTLAFAVTAGSGLWHSTYTAPNFGEWVRE